MFELIKIPLARTIKEFTGCACDGYWIPKNIKEIKDKLIVTLVCGKCGTDLTYILSTTDLDIKPLQEPSE